MYDLANRSNTSVMPRLTSKGQVTVPVAVRFALDLRPGDTVVFTIESGRGVFRKATARRRLARGARGGSPSASPPARSAPPDGPRARPPPPPRGGGPAAGGAGAGSAPGAGGPGRAGRAPGAGWRGGGPRPTSPAGS